MSKPRKPKPLTLAHLMRKAGKIPPESGGPFRNERMFLSERANDPETLRLRRAIADELAALAAKGAKFERDEGSKNDTASKIQQHVTALAKANQTSTAPELYQLADRSIIDRPGDPMSFDTFKRYVTEARKALGIKSRPGRRRK